MVCDTIWVIGDSFVAQSYGKILHSNSSTDKFYIREQFEAFAFFNINHFDNNFLSRTRNVLVKALNDHNRLPKVILMVLDVDLLKAINHTKNKFGVSLEGGILLEWLVAEIHKSVKIRKDQLPEKCKRPGEPHVIWMGLPLASVFTDNEKREKFNNSLQKLIPPYEDMSVLQPRKGWDSNNTAIFQNNQFTMMGLMKYWRAIDSAVHFWNSQKTGKTQVIQKGMSLENPNGEDDKGPSWRNIMSSVTVKGADTSKVSIRDISKSRD